MSIQVQVDIGGEQHTLVFPPDTQEDVIQRSVEQYQAENDPDRPSQFDVVTAQQRAQADQAKVSTMQGIVETQAALVREIGALRAQIAESNMQTAQAVAGLSQTLQQAAQMVAMAMTLPKTIVNQETGRRFDMSVASNRSN